MLSIKWYVYKDIYLYISLLLLEEKCPEHSRSSKSTEQIEMKKQLGNSFIWKAMNEVAEKDTSGLGHLSMQIVICVNGVLML